MRMVSDRDNGTVSQYTHRLNKAIGAVAEVAVNRSGQQLQVEMLHSYYLND